ncbi:MAG: hypothetical protein KKD18_04475 [Nanoarchaeota archaeon]|nr:hypothetical protein [Nanoarchaeota archaeon]MBU0977646.1 hypothetical protein [Nanoarchaeota archaeon]
MKKKASKRRSSAKKEIIVTENVCDRFCENRVLCWISRIIAILYIVFISLFALDAFSGSGNFWEVFVGFLIHLIPSAILVILLVVAWKHEMVGGWLYLILGVIFTIFYDTYESVITFFVLSGPLFFIGVLFLISAMKDSKS